MGTEVDSRGVVLPKIATSGFLVNPEPEEESDREENSNFARGQTGGGPTKSVSHGSSGNDSFVPKTLTSGSAPRPSGEARQFAERRIQHEEIFRDPKDRRGSKPASKRSTAAPQQQQHEDELQSSTTLRRDSSDSGVASADKTATTSGTVAESASSVPASSPRTRSDKTQASRSQPPSSETPASLRKQSSLARDDSGLLSTQSESPTFSPPAGKALVYDKQGNLVLKDRHVESGMSDPVPRRATKLDDKLKRIYFANTMRPRAKQEKPRPDVERREEVILTRREAQKWGNIHNIYGNCVEANKKRRHNKFMSKLELIQLEQAKKHNQEIIDKNLRSLETQKRQQDQLWRLRNRFDEEQRQRFYSQWVTMKNLQHEKCDRHLYGLPEEIYGETEHQTRLKRKKDKLVEKFDFSEQRKKNAERFKHYLNVNAGGNFDKSVKMPKVEPPNNLDVNVKTQSGKIWKDDEKKLKDILREAKREIKEVDSPRGSERTAEGPRPKPVKKEAAVKGRKPPQGRPQLLETYGQKTAAVTQDPAPKKSQSQQPRKPKAEKPAPAKAAGQSSKRFQKTGAGTFQIGVHRGPKPVELPESRPRRRLGSATSLNTVDFLEQPTNDKELDAFERARIKYNLAVDSDNESID